MTNQKSNIKELTIAAMCLALAMLLPFLTGQIPSIGSMLSPMHFPVLLGAFFISWKWAALVGFTAPLLRFAIFSMPPMPFGIAMAFEMATYGLVTSLVYNALPKKKINIYISMLIAMVLGRIVWGAARLVIAGATQSAFTWQLFIGGALLEAIPGIVLQLVLIPIIVMAVKKVK